MDFTYAAPVGREFWLALVAVVALALAALLADAGQGSDG
jgi:hypothetical protein